VPLHPPEILLAELARRREAQLKAQARQATRLKFLDAMHPAQRAFVDDPSKRKAALCGRRAGKSNGIAAWLLEGGEGDPGGLSVYVARSKGNARLIVAPAIERLSRQFDLGIRMREVDNQLMAWLPNGHRIWLAGAKDRSEVGKFRGPKYRRVAIDEAQEYAGYLQELVEDVFEPALLDQAGELCVAGTPSPIPAGFFYSATTGDGGPQWSTHHWTIFENPYIPDARAVIAELLRTRGWGEDHPTYQREYLGRWVRDEGALVYPYDGERNHFTELPKGDFAWVLAIDVGVVNSTAFVVACCRLKHPEVYIVEAWKREGLIPSAVAAHVLRYREQYPQLGAIVVDEDGLGKGYAEEMRKSYGIGCISAEKAKKRVFQEMTAGDLRAGVVRIDPVKCRPLLDEIQILQWGPGRVAEDERFENHAADAFLYACRALRPWYQPEEEPPKPGTPEHAAQEAKKERERAKEAARERSRRRGYRMAA
jgi:hypothetical protein